MTLLDDIFAHKRLEIDAQKRRAPLAALLEQIAKRPAALDFTAALRRGPQVALVAEVKRGSPSKGILVSNFDPVKLACQYAANGAAAISVLTDEKYFGGALDDLQRIAGLQLGTPLLRKEFICDPYQIYESRAAGADAVLLIAAALSDHHLAIFGQLARRLGLAALVEIHNQWEAFRALRTGATLIGINNRDLRDFSVNLATTRGLRPSLPASVVVVAESGITRPEDVSGLGVNAILVGEALVRAVDVGAQVRLLAGVPTSNPVASSTLAAEGSRV